MNPPAIELDISGYLPHQRRALQSTKSIVGMIGGTGGGKTVTGPIWLLSRHAADTRVESVSLAISPSYALAKKTTFPKIDKQWSAFARACGDRCNYTWDRGSNTYRIYWDTGALWTLYTGTADKPGSYEGVHVTAGAWGDEIGQDSVSLLAWETLKRRVALHNAQILVTTTPYNEGWLKDVVDEGNLDYIVFRSEDNPHYSKTTIEEARRSMPPWRFAMFYEGAFARSPLMIYPRFKDCIVNELPPVFDFTIACLDWGSTNPTAFYIIGFLGTSAYVFEEYYVTGKSSEEKYDHIQEMCKKYKVRILYVDPAAAQVIVDLLHRRCPATQGDNDVRSGIHRIQNLQEAKRFYVHSSCYNLVDEGKRYKWRTDKKENVIEVPIKESDHGLDAIRYGLWTFGEWAGRSRGGADSMIGRGEARKDSPHQQDY